MELSARESEHARVSNYIVSTDGRKENYCQLVRTYYCCDTRI